MIVGVVLMVVTDCAWAVTALAPRIRALALCSSLILFDFEYDMVFFPLLTNVIIW